MGFTGQHSTLARNEDNTRVKWAAVMTLGVVAEVPCHSRDSKVSNAICWTWRDLDIPGCVEWPISVTPPSGGVGPSLVR